MGGSSNADLLTSLDEAASIDRVLQRNIQTPNQTDLTGVYAVTVLQKTRIGNAVGGAITYNLPTAVGVQGMRFTFKKSDASVNAVTVTAFGAETIDGAVSRILSGQYENVSIESDGANWQVVVPTSQVVGGNLTVIGPAVTAVAVATAFTRSYFGDALAGAITFNLPTAVGIQGLQFTFKKTDASANPITVATFGAELIDGAAFQSLPDQYDTITVESDGANWQIVVPLSSGGTGGGGFSTSQAEDTTTGSFGSATLFPAYSGPILVLPFVQAGLSDVLALVNAESLTTPGSGFHDSALIGVSLDAGPIIPLESTTNQGLGDGRGSFVGGTARFPGVGAGPHTFTLHLTRGTALLPPATVLASPPFPLRIIALHSGGGSATTDIYAATLVVNATGANANFTTLEAALAALPVDGGRIFVREGVYTAPAGGYVMPDADVEIVCAGRGSTIFSRVAGGAGNVFSFGFDRDYLFSNFTILGDHGVTAQNAFVRSAAASTRRVKIKNVNVGSTLASADGVLVIFNSGGLQTNWDVSDCNFCLPVFPVSPTMIAGTALDNISLANIRTAGRSSITGSPILDATGFVMTALIVGGIPTFAIGGGSKLVSCVFLQAFATITFGPGCLVVNSIIAALGSISVGDDCSFIGCELGSVLAAGSRIRISGCAYLSFTMAAITSGHVLTGNRGTVTVSLSSATDCVIVGHAGSMSYTEPGAADRNRLSDIDFSTTPTVLGANTIVEGSRKVAVTGGVTGAVFAAVVGFPVLSSKGMLGIGTIKNTGGVNALVVRETVVDFFGVTTAVVSAPIPAGSDYLLDPQTNFGGAGGSRPPYSSYLLEVMHPVAVTTYDVQFAVQGSVS